MGAEAPGAANAADVNKLKAMARANLAIDFCMSTLFVTALFEFASIKGLPFYCFASVYDEISEWSLQVVVSQDIKRGQEIM